MSEFSKAVRLSGPGSALFFTVFTQTGNRAHTLHKVFTSLCEQTLPESEWLLVGDSSTDNTKEMIETRAKIADFAIRYFWQKNLGKHIANNLGIRDTCWMRLQYGAALTGSEA